MITQSALVLTKRLASPLVGVLATTGIMLATATVTLAQVTPTADPLREFQNPDAVSDPFSNRGSNQTSGMLDLIHRAMQGQSRSSEEFSTDQKENLDSAASEFRKLQQERLRQQQTPAAISPVPVPTPSK